MKNDKTENSTIQRKTLEEYLNEELKVEVGGQTLSKNELDNVIAAVKILMGKK